MAFVKLDCGILRSTTWADKDVRDVFLTALLMATPRVFDKPLQQLAVRNLELTGWLVPPGRYGFVDAAGAGIVTAAQIDQEAGLAALERLGAPEPGSRSQAYDGRRLVRVDGGYIALNYDRFREKDHTAGERQKRYRDKRNVTPSRAVKHRDVTQAEAEAEAEAEADQKPDPDPTRVRARTGWLDRAVVRPCESGAQPHPRHDPAGERFPFGAWSPSQQILNWARQHRLPDKGFDKALIELKDKVRGMHDLDFWDVKALAFLENAIAWHAAPPGAVEHRRNGGKIDAVYVPNDGLAETVAAIGRTK